MSALSIRPINSNVATVAAHRDAETAPMILGANLKTSDAVKASMQNVFGSDNNVNPNQFLYNYQFLHGAFYVTETVGTGEDAKEVIVGIEPANTLAILTNRVGPSAADLSGESTATHSDIYLGSGYSDVVSVPYNCNNLTEMVATMDSLAKKMTAVGKTGLYGDPNVIALDYKTYVENTRSRVEDAIEDGDVTEKTVAIVSAAPTEGQYIAYTEHYAIGTSINRAAEYLASTTTNIVELDGMVEKDNGNGSYTISGSSLAKADYVITVGFQGSNITYSTEADSAYQKLKGYFPNERHIFAQLPESTYGIYMNSVENALGQAIMIMGVYGKELGLDTNDAVAYFYDHFYHIKADMIDDLANEYFYADNNNCFSYTELNDNDTVSASIEAYEVFLN